MKDKPFDMQALAWDLDVDIRCRAGRVFLQIEEALGELGVDLPYGVYETCDSALDNDIEKDTWPKKF